MADNRILRSFSVSSPTDVRDTTNDPYQNVGISAQPFSSQHPLISKLLGLFESPNDPGIGPQAMEAPIGGIVLSPKNIEIIKDAISKLGTTNSQEIATRFISAKYPKLSSLVNKIIQHPNLPETAYGDYNHTSKIINLYNTLKQDIPETIDTLGHELTHATQFNRTPEMFNNYIQPSENLEAYTSHPTEIAARKGGSTAKQAFNNFLEMVFPRYDANQHISQTPDFIEQVVKPTFEERAAKIAEAESKPNLTKGNLADIKYHKEALNYDKDMVQRHLTPGYDPIADNRNPLTVGMMQNSLVIKDPLLRGQDYGTKYINPYMKQFLLNNGFKGTTTIFIPTGIGQKPFESSAINLDPNEVVRTLIK